MYAQKITWGVAGKTKYRLAGIFFPDRPPNKIIKAYIFELASKFKFFEYFIIISL